MGMVPMRVLRSMIEMSNTRARCRCQSQNAGALSFFFQLNRLSWELFAFPLRAERFAGKLALWSQSRSQPREVLVGLLNRWQSRGSSPSSSSSRRSIFTDF